MANIKKSLTELIGHTPLLELTNYNRKHGFKGTVIAKLESFNPMGSAKDRVGYAMIKDAEQQGILHENTVIIEPTSGNTGIGLAFVAASRGYRLILTMPETMSAERRSLLKALGAEIVLTDGALGMSGAIRKAEELAKQFESAFIPQQFENPSNPKAHYETTGPEIWQDTDGMVDVLVAGVGTGGTISGAGKYLKEQNPNLEIIAVEPSDSAVLSGGKAGPHKLQGIGAGFVPKVYNASVVDRVVTVTAEEAFGAARAVSRDEGLLIGISGGAALHAASEIAKNPAYTGKRIVVVLPDTGERYLSTELFQE
ncbi:MAG TPA: cysteine synthase A [Firmicutes bacterium]|nr:cysteine synthase A [Bacillota bacterium]